VSVKLADQTPKGATASAVHFEGDVEGTTEVLDASSEGDVTTFDATGFSVYGVIYTVDFHWDVDGQTYDFSIQGGDTLSLRELLVALNVIPADEAEDFMDQVSDVTFSDPELIAVAKVDEDTTAGALKEALELQPEYSSELTEESIAAMDAKELTAPDWALMTLKAFDTEETLTIVMANGDIFTIKVTDARDPLGLDGRTFAIVTQRENDNRTLGNWYSLQSSVQQNRSNRGYYMDARQVTRDVDGTTGTEYCDASATAWKFEYYYNEDEETGEVTSGYYISAGGKYLYIDPTKATKDDTNTGDNPNPHSLNLVDSKEEGTLLQITRNEDGTYCISNAKGLKLWNYGNNSYWLANDETAKTNSYVHLCLPEAHGSNDPHKATLISAADIQDGQKVVIYQRVLQSSDDTFTYYAIDGNGNLVEVSPSSDAIYWRGDKAIEWTVKTSGSYVTLYNEQTGTYLTPNGDGKLVHTLADYEDDTNKTSVTLPGRDRGAYTSKISCWDYDAHNTYGPNVQATTTQQGEVTDVALQSVLFEDSQTFYFAARDPIVHDQLTTVDTVDSVSKGITIKMYDWGSADGSDAIRNSDGWDTYSQSSGHNPAIQTRLQTMLDVMGTGDDDYKARTLFQGIASNTLDSDTGFPTSTYSGRNLSELFNDTYLKSSNANNLFLQSVYDETGYFKYSSFENYAYFSGNDFTVYEQIGTPSTRATKNPGGGDYTSISNPADYYKVFMRGNFMPYNPIDPTMYYRFNEYDPDLNPLSSSDPRYNERLYFIENGNPSWSPNPEANANYFFGMTVEATFAQNPGGISDHGDPMVFEFNGDDDMWVYIDDVLVLDVGGVHDAFRGTINFRTGAVKVYSADHGDIKVQAGAGNGTTTLNKDGGVSVSGETTIKDMFWAAHKFPDGSDWTDYNDSKVADFFEDNTFKDYSIHDFKMIYMERGASASNLEMMFNLPTLPETAFRVGKEMPETQSGKVIQDEYADAYFYYEAWHEVEDANAEGGKKWVKYTRGDFTGDNIAYYNNMVDENGNKIPVVWKSNDNNETIFEVKPGQIAVFPVADGAYDTNWKVCEVEPEPESVMLNNFEIHNTSEDKAQPSTPAGKDWASYPWSTEGTIRQRNQVIYTNKPDDALVNELRITKRLNGDMIKMNPDGPDDESNYIKAEDGSAYFEYKVFLETTDGRLLPYSPGQDGTGGSYYQIDSEGNYVYYDHDGKRKLAAFDGTYYTYTYNDGTIETLTEPKISGHASANGSIAFIHDGDTIVIKGLLEGTEFLVYERIDRSIMSKTSESDGNTYVFEGATIESGSAYNRITDEGAPGHIVGPLFYLPDMSGVSYTVTEGEGTGYEADHRAQGAILQNSNAEVTVRNRGANPFAFTVEKRWDGVPGNDSALNDSQIVVTLGRYTLQDKVGTLNIVKTGVPEGAAATATYTIEKKNEDGSYSPAATCGNSTWGGDAVTVGSIPLPPGTYRVTEVVNPDDEAYNHTHEPGSQEVTIADGDTETVTFTSTYTPKTGSLVITSSLTNNTDKEIDTSDVAYTVYDAAGTQVGSYSYEQIQNAGEDGLTVSDLRIGEYRVVETGWPTVSGTILTHDPAAGADSSVSISQNVTENSSAPCAFSTTYEQPQDSGSTYSIHRPSGWQGYQLKEGAIDYPPGTEVVLSFDTDNPGWDRTTDGNWKVIYNGAEVDKPNITSDNVGNARRYSIRFTVIQNAVLDITINADNNQLGDVTISEVTGLFSLARPNSMRSSAPKHAPQFAAKSPSSAEAYISDSGNPPADTETQKYVVDTAFNAENHTVTLTIDDYDSASGNWKELVDTLPATDDHGNKYYYYIQRADETGLLTGTTGSIVKDENGYQVLAYKMDSGDPNTLAVYNKVGQPADVSIVKVAEDENGQATSNKLAGAKFHLLKDNELISSPSVTAIESSDGVIELDTTTGVFTVPLNGLTIHGLEPGSYTLVEDSAPAGYVIDNGSFAFTVNQDGTVTSSYASGLTLTIPNPPGAELPEAGGPGTLLHTLCGLALFVAAGYVGLASKRTARKEVA
jgi:fibro-slime domain-containing protein